MNSKVGISVVLMSLLLVISSLAVAITPVSADKAEVEVIIGFTNKSQASQAVLNSGGRVNQIYTIIPAMFANIPENALEALQRNPNVRYVEPNAEVFALEQTVPWGIDRVFGDDGYSFSTWVSSRGSGVTVAVLDTGIDKDHEDLNVLGGTNTIIDGTLSYADGYGHGTHVAGTIAALDNDLGVVGVAPEVGLYAVKVLDDSGSGTVASVLAGIEWSVGEEIDIISMSLGSSSYSEALQDACDAAYSLGTLLVASAGNSGNPPARGDNVGYPAKYDSVIAVAATDINDARARWSSTGPAVELAAPGVNIYSTLPANNYGTASGTSMACPHVTGVAALVFASDINDISDINGNNEWDAAEVRAKLEATADDLGIEGRDYLYGFGLVDADEAVGVPITDMTPPTISDLKPSDGAVINDLTPTISATVKDTSGIDLDSIIMTLDGDVIDHVYENGLVSCGTVTLTDDSYTIFLTVSDMADNPNQAIITWSFTIDTTPPTQKQMSASIIDLKFNPRPAGKNIFYSATATVEVVDAEGAPLIGATVYGSWAEETSDSDLGTTNIDGMVSLTSDSVKNPDAGTTFTFEIDNVILNDYEYVPGDETTGSIIIS